LKQLILIGRTCTKPFYDWIPALAPDHDPGFAGITIDRDYGMQWVPECTGFRLSPE